MKGRHVGGMASQEVIWYSSDSVVASDEWWRGGGGDGEGSGAREIVFSESLRNTMNDLH